MSILSLFVELKPICLRCYNVLLNYYRRDLCQDPYHPQAICHECTSTIEENGDGGDHVRDLIWILDFEIWIRILDSGF